MECILDWPETEESKRTRQARERRQGAKIRRDDERRFKATQDRLEREALERDERHQHDPTRERHTDWIQVYLHQRARNLGVLRAALLEIPEGGRMQKGTNYGITLTTARAVVITIERRSYR